MHATQSFLYTLIFSHWSDTSPSGATELRLYRLNRSDLTYNAHWVLTGDANFSDATWGIHAFSDTLIFLVKGIPTNGDLVWTFGYFKPADATTHLIGTVGVQCTSAGSTFFEELGAQSEFFYSMNYFYLSWCGEGVGTTNVLKIGPLHCPTNPLIPWESAA